MQNTFQYGIEHAVKERFFTFLKKAIKKIALLESKFPNKIFGAKRQSKNH